ncbi:NAD(P)-dependent alcohol dehydrogenase [Synoicihabitans lomoniglobus]|uniref:NAD(P)-dependent alcohol dehydrogenase n=1 Tax=Synoicihabitans lomoniglobus TaxID=2909285 RepID=A0AAE9ZUP3_9BACT|nr:NAD(P)-dependent alcohol dehydrogenase [Opitutaceae bacterium LMO-M01]WED63130.1 NAD(P)-dependent alcohol dehydrogenase [Opitutaceae bacterium LMO-M01]
MKAVIYQQYGPPSVLVAAEVEPPQPKAGEVTIRVHAVEVTKADCEMRSFRFPVAWFWLPLRIAFGIRRPRRQILGSYFAGEVVATSATTSRFKVGEAVFGCSQLRLGAYGEMLCLPERYTIEQKPKNLSFAEAAAVPLGALNALHFLTKVELMADESILIIGAGGSIGLFAIQIAKVIGAKVTAVDKAAKAEVVRQAGADVFIDYTQQEFWKTEERYDVVFSMVAGGSFKRSIGVLKPEGRYAMGNPRVSDMVRSIGTRWFSQRRAFFGFASESPDELRVLKIMIEAGSIRPIVDRVFPLVEAPEAHRRVENEERLGSIVLAVGARE